MNPTYRSLLLCLLAQLLASAVSASTLRVVVDKRPVRAVPGGSSTLQITWADAPVMADVTLDVYALPSIPSSNKAFSELSKLNAKTWLDHVAWQLRRGNGEFTSIPREKIQFISFEPRHRGPKAPEQADQDAAIDVVSYSARANLGRFPVGDYQLRVNAFGLRSEPSVFAVREGTENASLRDAYLEQKSAQTSDYERFKQLQLERLKLDPSKAGAWMALAERAIVSGSLSETREFLQNALRTMDENAQREGARSTPERAAALSTAVEQNRKLVEKLQAILPEYFAHRAEWILTAEQSDGQTRYVVRERTSQRVVRTVE